MQTELIKHERTAIWQAGYCVVCGDEITGTAEHVCKSRFCFAKWNNWTRIKDRWHELHRECQWCGKMFRVDRKPKNTNPQKFCSNECSGPGAMWGTPKSMRMRLLIRSVRARREAAVRQRGQRCEICGEYTNRGPVATVCEGECEKERERRRALEIAKQEYTPYTFACEECGTPVVTQYGDMRRKFCGGKCARRFNKRMRRYKHGSDNNRRRCKRAGVPYVSGISRKKVLDRDGWKCGICQQIISKDIDYNPERPHPSYGTIDHIIPLSVDGSPGHVWRNVQAAHWGCNVDKGAGVARNDQLRLL